MYHSKLINRSNGSQLKIVAELFHGSSLKPSIGHYVLARDCSASPWRLLSDRPAEGWRDMSVEEYKQHGRSEMLQAVAPGLLLQVGHELMNLFRFGCINPAAAQQGELS